MAKFASFDSNGLPVAFYSGDIHGENIPTGAVEISHNDWLEFINNSGMRRWDGEKVVEYTPPLPMPTADDYRREIQNLIDTKAQEKDYDSGATLASYVSSTIPQWAAEAQAFVAWRDAVWLHALTELDKVQSGARSQPTIEGFLAELPTMEWP
ncbi:hypothetical protein ACFOLL_12540 [Falsochrobactrum ovis]|uniref:Tail fiber assembly protein n=1 Tax=Falsochrobactrum ovis TaxID=1293442 RepID=A0A364JTB2_9HYPH|nr:hypothetical protein [Falsochrobactrum ovis]RAK26391.1 hypothetical protein C7374_11477 [Falsochrobactrum ovis]